MTDERVHAYDTDALGEHDAVGLADLIRRGERDATEVAAAAIARAERVDPELRAVASSAYERALADSAAPAPGPLSGVPTYVKDNTDVRGMVTGHGSAAVRSGPAADDAAFTRQFRSAGFTVLGKSRLPEFGLNASTEFVDEEPARNPWHTGHSPGASSGGAAALVASGVVPIAHGNDGGGSIRIPAACCGLVGLKPTRGRLVDNDMARHLPINLIGEGVLTRTVRDTAAFVSAAEQHWSNPRLPAIGYVRSSRHRRLRVGLVTESVGDTQVCPRTREAVEATARVLEGLGHTVEPVRLPFDERFVRDFLVYWGLLAFLISSFGKHTLGPGFDPGRLDGLTSGLARLYRRNMHRTPGTLYRLNQARSVYTAMFAEHDVVLSPVLAHAPPRIGYLSPVVPFDELVERLTGYVAFTPMANVTGAPAMALPATTTPGGLPIGVQLSGAPGADRTLLELGYELEQANPWSYPWQDIPIA